MSEFATLRRRVLDRAVDTEAAFSRLHAGATTAFWLDSGPAGPHAARFSFLGDAAGPLAEVVHYRIGGGVRVTARGHTRYEPGGILDYLSAALRTRYVPLPDDLPFDFAGGYIGYLGYEVKAECGGSAGHTAPTPDAQWIFADRVVVVDHLDRRTYLLALTDEQCAQQTEEWFDATTAVLDTLPTDSPGTPATAASSAAEPVTSRGRAQYLRDIAACHRALQAGESYEITLTDRITLPADTAGLDAYRALRRANPAPYSAYLRFDDLEIACSSPERFLKLDRHRVAETKPIKGTAPRDPDPVVDERLRRALTEDPKTRAENVMIVDLLRNDLGRVCTTGSVRVAELLTTETYTTLHQLVSTVRGTLRADIGVIDCLRACFPGGSMTGAPKIRTMQLIDALEQQARGVYSGTIGFLGAGGTADLNIVIRTAVRYAGKWQIGTGGAIVLDSEAEAEYQEILLKADAVLRAVRAPGAATLTGAAASSRAPVHPGTAW